MDVPLTIVRNDITKMSVDAVVNAANTELRQGGGVSGAIFKAAGSIKLAEACSALSPIPTGQAVITPGFALPASYIIHAVGPIYEEKDPSQSQELLYSAYLNALKLAIENKLESIAFPLISAGIYGYPKREALMVAQKAIREFLKDNYLDVYLVVYDKESFEISQETLGPVKAYISDNYVKDRPKKRRAFPFKGGTYRVAEDEPLVLGLPAKELNKDFVQALTEGKVRLDNDLPDLIELIESLDESFAETLFRIIDSKGLDDVTVYKKANIDRKLFSKIRSAKNYLPGKRTIIALAIALELSLRETNSLLSRAGYTLSRSQLFDVIIEYFIINQKYDIYEINEILFSYDQPLLGGVGA